MSEPPARRVTRRSRALATIRAHGALSAFGAGATVIALVLVVVISQPGLRRAGYNLTPNQRAVGTLPVGGSGCQPEPFSADTRAVLIHALPKRAGRVAIRIAIAGAGTYDGTGAPSGILATGIVAPLPHGPPPPTLGGTGRLVTMCVLNVGSVPLELLGAATGADRMTVARPGGRTRTTVGRIRVDDLLDLHPESLWSVLPKLLERFTAATGSPLAPWLVVLGMIVALLAAIALLRRAGEGGRTRVEVALVVALTIGTGMLWAAITPAFQKTDEPAHFAYVEAVATLGHPPTAINDIHALSPQIGCWTGALLSEFYRFFPEERPLWNDQALPALDRICGAQSPQYDGAQYQGNQPPAYYLAAAAVDSAASSAPLPTRLLAVRMFSVLLAALAVAFTYLMVRELIPRPRWPARAAALALALQPIFMFNESGVNSDAMVVAVAAAIAFVVMRAWRRGLNSRHALALGALTGLGIVSKLNFLALVPSIALLGGGLWWARSARQGWHQRLLTAARLAAGALVALGIYGFYVLVNNDVWHRGGAGQGATLATSVGGGAGGLRRMGDFIWQFFLPRLPGRPRLFAYYPLWHDLLNAVTTRLGWWNDFGFDGWAPALVVLGFAIAALAAVYIIPRARRRPWPPLVALAALAIFLVALVLADYQLLSGYGDGFEGRYVFPAMPLWGLLVGCAVAAAPKRWRPALTGVLAALFLAHTVIAVSSLTSVYYL